MTDHVTVAAVDAEVIAARIPAASEEVRGSREQIGEIVAFIARTYRPERVILYGSRAYGTPTYGSDVDLLIVMETPPRPVDQAVAIRERLDPRPSFSLDVLVRTPAQIAAGLADGDFFIEDVIEKGITQYQADSAGLD